MKKSILVLLVSSTFSLAASADTYTVDPRHTFNVNIEIQIEAIKD